MSVKPSSAKNKSAKKSPRKSTAAGNDDEEPLSVDFDEVAAQPVKRVRRQRLDSMDASAAIKNAGSKKSTDKSTKIKKDSQTLGKALGSKDKSNTVTISKTFTIKRKNKAPIRKPANSNKPAGPRRKGKKKPIVKKVVKKVVIHKHKSKKKPEPEKDPDPIIIRRKKGVKKGPKKVIQKVIVKKKKNAQNKQQDPEPEPVVQRIRKRRQHRASTANSSTLITIVKKRKNPLTGEIENYEEKVTPEELAKQMKEAEERKKDLADDDQDDDENPNDPSGKKRKRRHRKVQYVTVIKKRINKDTGREETYEEQIAIPAADDEPTLNPTPSSPRKSSAKRKSSARPSNANLNLSDDDDEADSESDDVKPSPKAGGGKKKPKKVVKKTTIIKKQRKQKAGKVEEEPEPETQVIRVRKRKDPKKIVHQVVTVVKKRINPETGKEELVEEKVPIELSESSSDYSIEDQIFFDELKKKTNPKAHRNTTAGFKNKSRKNSTAKKPSAAARRGSTSNLSDLVKKSGAGSLPSVEPIDSLLLEPKSRKRRRRKTPIEKIITEIVLESDDEGERKPVQRQKTIIEEYYSDYSDPEVDFRNIKIFISDDEEDNMGKKRQRDIPGLLSRIDRSKKGPDEVHVDDFGISPAITSLLQGADDSTVPLTNNQPITDKDLDDVKLSSFYSDPKTGINGDKLIAQVRPDLVQNMALDALAKAQEQNLPFNKYLENQKIDPLLKDKMSQYNAQRQNEITKIDKSAPIRKLVRTFGVHAEA